MQDETELENLERHMYRMIRVIIAWNLLITIKLILQ